MRSASQSFSTFALLAVVVAVPTLAIAEAPPAHAQSSSGSGSSGPGGPSSAPYPVCGVAGTKQPSPDDVAAARKTYELGNRYMSEADYDRAILYFRDAYRSDCTAHKLLTFIARAHELRGDRTEAVRALETYLERAPNGDDRATVEKRIANLKSQIAAPVAPVAPVAPASVYAPVRLPASASASSSASSAAPPTELPPSSRRGHGVVPWIVVGGGVVIAAVGAVVFVGGSSQVADAEAACGGAARRCTSPEQITNGNDGRSQMTTGGVVLGVGVAAIAGGLVWHFLEPTGPGVDEKTSATAMRNGVKAARPAITPSFAPSYAGATLHGEF